MNSDTFPGNFRDSMLVCMTGAKGRYFQANCGQSMQRRITCQQN